MIAENLANLVDRDAQPVMKPRRQCRHTMAERRVRQSIRHNRLDMLFTGRAVVAVDRVLDDFGSQIVENILDGARAFSVAALQLAATVGAAILTMFFGAVDSIGFGSANAFAVGLCARFWPCGLPWSAPTLRQ